MQSPSTASAEIRLRLQIPESRDVMYAYVCEQHAYYYMERYGRWASNPRRVQSLHVACQRCAQIAEQRHMGAL